jgi:hypothetical protein
MPLALLVLCTYKCSTTHVGFRMCCDMNDKLQGSAAPDTLCDDIYIACLSTCVYLRTTVSLNASSAAGQPNVSILTMQCQLRQE